MAGTGFFWAAALCLALAGCAAPAHAAGSATIEPGAGGAQAALDALESGGTLIFAAGKHPDLGEIIVSKPATLTGEPGAVISGDSTLRVRSSGVTVENLTFSDITRARNERGQMGDHEVISVGMWSPDNRDLRDISISGNTITDTASHGIRIIDDQSAISNLRITGNVLKNIGTAYPEGYTLEQKAGRLLTAIRTAEHGLLRDLRISGNTIDTATFAGINVGASGIINGHISGNSISNMPAFGIQKAVERTHGEGTPDARKLAGPEAGLEIYGNTITAANNSLRYLDGRHEAVPEAAIVIWGADDSNTDIRDNVIRESHNGILLCAQICGVQDDRRGELLERFRVSEAPTDRSVRAFGNSFLDNTGYDLVNMEPGPMPAPFNYWGPDPPSRTSGSVAYWPYYADEEMTVLAEGPRPAHAGPGQDCSVRTDGRPEPFGLVPGGESNTVARKISNAGTERVEELRLRAGPWTGAGGEAYAGLVTVARVSGMPEFVELVPGMFTQLEGAELPAGSALYVELKAVHSGGPGPASDLRQATDFLAGCR